MTDGVIDSFRELSTTTVSDALDRLGVHGTCLGITPLDVSFRATGRAVTLKYEPVSINKTGTVGDYIDDVEPGCVLVLDNAGRLDGTVWGDILTSVAHQRGLGGTVINGVCRDVAKSLMLKYPVFSLGRFMRTGKDRVQLESMQTPVSLGDVRVTPGDVIVGDADGVVVVPSAIAERVLELARSIDQAEQRIRDATASGMRLDEARRQFRYWDLQRKEDGP